MSRSSFNTHLACFSEYFLEYLIDVMKHYIIFVGLFSLLLISKAYVLPAAFGSFNFRKPTINDRSNLLNPKMLLSF